MADALVEHIRHPSRDDGFWHIAFVDGYISHKFLKALRHLHENKVLVVFLPSHNSDKDQPADQGINAALKADFSRRACHWRARAPGMTIGRIARNELLAQTYKHLCDTPRIAKSAWARAGLFPFNQNAENFSNGSCGLLWLTMCPSDGLHDQRPGASLPEPAGAADGASSTNAAAAIEAALGVAPSEAAAEAAEPGEAPAVGGGAPAAAANSGAAPSAPVSPAAVAAAAAVAYAAEWGEAITAFAEAFRQSAVDEKEAEFRAKVAERVAAIRAAEASRGGEDRESPAPAGPSSAAPSSRGSTSSTQASGAAGKSTRQRRAPATAAAGASGSGAAAAAAIEAAAASAAPIGGQSTATRAPSPVAAAAAAAAVGAAAAEGEEVEMEAVEVPAGAAPAKEKLRRLLQERQEREMAALVAELQARHARERASLEADEDPDLVRVEHGREVLKTVLGDCPSAQALRVGDAAWTALQRSYLKPLQELRQEQEREANAKGRRPGASHPLNTQTGLVMNEDWLNAEEQWFNAKQAAEVEAAARKEVREQTAHETASERAAQGKPLVEEHVDAAASAEAALDALQKTCTNKELVSVLCFLTPNPKVSGNKAELVERLKPLVQTRCSIVDKSKQAVGSHGRREGAQADETTPIESSARTDGGGGGGGAQDR